MAKKLVISTLAFIILNVLLASAFTKYIIDVGSNIVINGKNITIVGISGSNAVNFLVDGVAGKVNLDEPNASVNGVDINVSGLSTTNQKVIIYLEVDFSCGDGSCSNLEDSVICCKDCGCIGLGKACINNICGENITSQYSRAQCYNNTDCSDNKRCTLDICNITTTPSKCVFTEITQCNPNDGCCPLGCDQNNDNDCATINQCSIHSQCDDNNPCTKDECSGAPTKCVNTKTEGCPLNNECLSIGSINQGKYCYNEWKPLKFTSDSCTKDYECLSKICFLEKCRTGKTAPLVYIAYIAGVLALILAIYLVYASVKA